MKKRIFNEKGLTLIELILTVTIMGIVIMVAYPMLDFTYKTTNTQLKESNERNEVRVVSTHLKNDIEYSKELTLFDKSTLCIVNSDDEVINYYVQRDGDSSSLIRETESAVEFEGISDVEFHVLNDHLLQAKLITDVENNKYTEFKIFRWNMIVDRPGDEDDSHEFIINEKVFLFANHVYLSGNSVINGPSATVIFKDDLDFSGNGEINTSNIYVDGNILLSGNASLGKSDNTSSIYVTGDISRSGNSKIYGEIIDEDFEFPNIAIPPMNDSSWYLERGYTAVSSPRNNMKYYGGDISFSGNGNFKNVTIASRGDIMISGNVDVTGILYAPTGKVVLSGNSTFKGLIIANEILISNKSITFEPAEINDLPF